MNKALQQAAFDYGTLQSTDALELRLAAERIRTRLKRTAEDIVAIGQELLAAKERLGHGRFLPWIAAEFEGMSEDTAERFMHVADRLTRQILQSAEFAKLPVSVLYLLAAPSTPDAVVERVASGAIPATAEAIKAAKDDAKRARQEAEQAKRELWDARTTASEADLQRKRAEGEVAQVRKHMDLLRSELEEARETAVGEPQYIEVVPEDVQQRVRALETEIKQLEAQRAAIAKPDAATADALMLATLARMLRAQLSAEQRQELIRLLSGE